MNGLICLVVLSVAASVYGSSFYNEGACPSGQTVGSRWNPANTCLECYCDQTGYGCSGCGEITPVEGCYTVVNKTAPYPDCCPRLQCLTFGGLGV